MIIVIDTFGGLCNQFYDIYTSVLFCINHNLKFSFRYCSFRNDNLISWYNQRFDKLFDMSFLKLYKKLYVNYDKIKGKINRNNTFNIGSKRAINVFKKNYIQQISKIIGRNKKKFIILKQFWAVHKNHKNYINFYKKIKPSDRLMNLYSKIKNSVLNDGEKYNFIHYRYEKDFVDFFGVKIENFTDLVGRIKLKFDNQSLRIYIAASNVEELVKKSKEQLGNIVIYKSDKELKEYNFEELAFIDYMFGLNSEEIYGHNKSSFSHMLNDLNGTKNFYNV